MSGRATTQPGMRGRVDLTGRKFGRWAVLGLEKVIGRGVGVWRAECECGTVRGVRDYKLKRGESTSCGCLSVERCRTLGRSRAGKAPDGSPSLISKVNCGAQFGGLTVKVPYDSDPSVRIPDHERRWVCKCRCGALVVIKAERIAYATTKSCGCRALAWAAQRVREAERFQRMVQKRWDDNQKRQAELEALIGDS